MKVCMLSGSSFEKNYASYHLMRDLICHLLEDGHEVNLIQKCFSKPGCLPPELADKAGLTVSDISFKEADKNNLIKRMQSDLSYYIKTAKSIRRSKNCDVFFLQSNNVPWLPIGLIKILTRKPVVYNVQDIFPQNAIFAEMISEKSIISRILLKLQKWVLKHSTAVITISEDMRETLVEAGADPDKVHVVYNWKNSVNDEGKFIPKDQDGKFHVVYAGNIGRMQNVEVIVRAAAEIANHPEIQFDIYGNGALKETCIMLAQELHATNVTFFDPVPAAEAHSLYENADLNIVPLAKNIIKTALPSKTAVCIECGKPVIFAIGETSMAAKMISERESAKVIESDDFIGMTKLIMWFYNNRNKAAENVQQFECFQKKNVNKYVNVLQQIVNERR